MTTCDICFKSWTDNQRTGDTVCRKCQKLRANATELAGALKAAQDAVGLWRWNHRDSEILAQDVYDITTAALKLVE